MQVFVEIGDWRPLFPTRVGEEIGDIGQARLNIVTHPSFSMHMDLALALCRLFLVMHPA